MCAAFDRANVTDRTAMHILAPTLSSQGLNLSNVCLSRSTLQRARKQARKQLAVSIKKSLNHESKIVVQWDGKLLPDYSTSEKTKVDRLPILVKGVNIDELLGIPKLENGTAIKQFEAIKKLLFDYNLFDQVAGMCFDTTATNTGPVGGTCVLLEQFFERKLLHLACRHHIAELILKVAFDEKMGSSTAPDITLFKNFQAKWPDLDKNDYKSGISDAFIKKKLAMTKDDLISFSQNILQVQIFIYFIFSYYYDKMTGN